MKSFEERLLLGTKELLSTACAELFAGNEGTNARLTLLEAVASLAGGWKIEEYWESIGEPDTVPLMDPLPWAEKVLASLSATQIPVPLALAALAREVLPAGERRRTGAYYTDWRLAEHLAQLSVARITEPGLWVDAACGTGVLLVAATMQVPVEQRDAVIRDRLTGADLSANALRGALLSVASLTSNLAVIRRFSGRLLVQDSLRSREVWKELMPEGAALVIGNPPWEKLRVTKHEVAKSSGAIRAYGENFDTEIDLKNDRTRLLAYVEQVASGTRLQGRGEHDLYKLFLELGIGLVAENGVIALLLPAGLLRSNGTEQLRRELISVSTNLDISVIENRARHFAIDTRFKFLSVVATVGGGTETPISLRVADRSGALPETPVSVDRSLLKRVREDLSIPEVKSSEEWELYIRLAKDSTTIGDPAGQWHPHYHREVDMTFGRKFFRPEPGDNTIPVLEGRHVSQYRWRSKAYRSGRGRSAIWRIEPLPTANLRAQWHMPINEMKSSTYERTLQTRIGFCDITGQTNERSLLAARIPEGVVCGNKVPTLSFSSEDRDKEDLFLALANSLVVDWMLRRIVTTTVNFFLFDTLHFPDISPVSATGRELIRLSRQISQAEGNPSIDRWALGELRARVDALVAYEWGLNTQDMELVLCDFPLLDRGQPPLQGENTSTITSDCVVAALAELKGQLHPATKRRDIAQKCGAVPFVPAEYAREAS